MGNTAPIKPSDGKSRCDIHSPDCIGHMEALGNMLFMPSTFTPSSPDAEHPLYLAKSKCVSGTISYDD